MKRGIDISHHQGDVNFDLLKNDIDFVILRDGYKVSTDRKFFEYASKCLSLGIPILGVYHFSYALNTEDAKKEALFCIENIKKAGLPNNIFVFYDYEYDTVGAAAKEGVILTPKDCNEFTVAFCETLIENGYRAGVYTNIDYYKNQYNQETLNTYHVWLADYKGEADYPCLIQQYTSSGKLNGIGGKVDMDYYRGVFPWKSNEQIVAPSDGKAPISQIVKEVIAGKWGNGNERKNRLENAGYDYEEIRKLVNEYYNK